MKSILLVVAVAALYILHQDIWFWRSQHLVFGFIPIGLFYHGVFSVAAALLMWLLVTYAWPSHLEQEVEETKPREDEAA
jgi:Na+(H+)/acetate symporter ActP